MAFAQIQNVQVNASSRVLTAPSNGFNVGSGESIVFQSGSTFDASAAAVVMPAGATNLVWATPNGTSGNPSLRALVAGDIPSLTMSKISDAGPLATVASASAALDLIGNTRGSILYRGASGWAILAPGTSGYVLSSNGAGADPSYIAAGVGNVTGAASSTAHRLVSFADTTGKALEDASTITISGGTLTGSSALGLTAGGTNQNITLTPSGSGSVQIPVSGSGSIYQASFTNATNAAGNTAGFKLANTGAGWEIRFRTNPSNGWFEIADNTDSIQHRWQAKDYLLSSTGKIGWSSESNFATAGVGARDTNLYRSSAGVLKTDTAFVAGTTITGTHLIGGSAAPTIAAGTGAGTSPTISILGTDLGFKITLTTGTSPTASGTVATVTFNSAYASAPYFAFSPANANAAALSGTSSVFGGSSTTTFTLTAGSAALTAATQYIWTVVCAQ